MSVVYSDLTLEVTATIGIGDVWLGGTLPGYRTFGSTMQDGDTCRYGIREWATGAFEFGEGTYHAAANTLSRAPSDSSNAGNMPINLVGSPNTQIYMSVDGSTIALIPQAVATAAVALSVASDAGVVANAAMPNTVAALTAIIALLPSSSDGLPVGTLWNDGGVLSIV